MAWWGRIRLPAREDGDRLDVEELRALALRAPHFCHACRTEHEPSEDCPKEGDDERP